MLQQDKPEDFVIATDVQYSVRDFVNAAAKEPDIAITWQGNGVDEKGFDTSGKYIVQVDPRYFWPTEVTKLAHIGWRSTTSLSKGIRIAYSNYIRLRMD